MVHGSTLASSIESCAHRPSLHSNTIKRQQLQGAYALMRHHRSSSPSMIQCHDVPCLEYTTQQARPLFRADTPLIRFHCCPEQRHLSKCPLCLHTQEALTSVPAAQSEAAAPVAIQLRWCALQRKTVLSVSEIPAVCWVEAGCARRLCFWLAVHSSRAGALTVAWKRAARCALAARPRALLLLQLQLQLCHRLCCGRHGRAGRLPRIHLCGTHKHSNSPALSLQAILRGARSLKLRNRLLAWKIDV